MVYLFLAQGNEEIEALTVVDLLRRAGIEIKTVSITDSLNVVGAHAIEVKADVLFKDIDFDKADMLVLPGGNPGFKNLGAFEPLMKKVDEFAANGKYVAAICGAPTEVGKRGNYKGKTACCYPDMESMLIGAKVSYDKVCVDGNLITSRGMGTAIDFSLTIVSLLKDKETADKLAKGIVYR